jgi:subtilisin family serine protease
MAKLIVTMCSETHKTNSAAMEYLEANSIKVNKCLAFARTFEVDCRSAERFKGMDGILEIATYDTVVGFAPQVDNSHLNRLFGKGLSSLPEDYVPISTGEGQTIYLMDSGIDGSHEEFSDRNIVNLYTGFDVTEQFDYFGDSNGHGTAMASLIVGNNVGVAKDATLYNVKIFDGEESGQVTVGNIIEALSAILANHRQQDVAKAKIVCMPWTITPNDFIDRKIEELINNNLVCVAAAGNDAVNVSTVSPAGVPGVLTVGAVTDKFIISDFSNYGLESEMWAQGVNVSAADISGSYTPISGTSVSAAISAGIVSHYTDRYPHLDAASIKHTVIAEGTVPGKVLITTIPSINLAEIRYSLLKTDEADQVQLCAYRNSKFC